MIATAKQGTEPWHAFPSSNPQDTSQVHSRGVSSWQSGFLTLQSLFASSKLGMTDLLGQLKEKTPKTEFQICRILIEFKMKTKLQSSGIPQKTKSRFPNTVQWTIRFLYFIEYIEKALQQCVYFFVSKAISILSHIHVKLHTKIQKCSSNISYISKVKEQTCTRLSHFLLSVLKQN